MGGHRDLGMDGTGAVMSTAAPPLDKHALRGGSARVAGELVQGALGLTGLARVITGNALCAASCLPGHEYDGDQHQPESVVVVVVAPPVSWTLMGGAVRLLIGVTQ
jgi:hypothetical protein